MPDLTDALHEKDQELSNINSLVALNNVFTDKNHRIIIKKNYSLKKPLIIYNTTNNKISSKNLNLNLNFILEENSCLKLINISDDDSRSNFINSYYTFHLKKHSILKNYKIDLKTNKNIKYFFNNIDQEENSISETFFLSSGSTFSKNEVNCNLKGKFASAFVNGIFSLNNKKHHEIKSNINHLFENTKSYQLIKAVLGDESKAVYQGKIFVNSDAQKTDGYQLSKAILLNETSEFNSVLKKSKNPIIIIGTSAINFSDGKDIINICAEIAKKFPNASDNFNPLNILNQDISRVGALELGYYNKFFDFDFENKLKNLFSKTKPVVFLLGQDEINMKNLEGAFVVYLGHHGDEGASIADVILPSPAYTEKSSTYMNTEGRVLQTSKCFSPLGDAKEEWKIFRVLSESFNKNILFNNINELRKELISSFAQFANINEIPFDNKISIGSDKLISDREFNYNIENFYMNDSISRASETMANCSKEIINKVA